MAIIADKNITPSRLAWLCTLPVIALLFILLLLAHVPWLWIGIILLLSTALSYWLINYSLNYFFFRKIKLIYKFISSTKANYQEEALQELLPQTNNLSDVSKEVIDWAQNQKDEIELLQQTENFRRDFLMNLSHEIKTPIFSVQASLHTLQQGAAEQADTRQKFLNNAIRGIDRLAILINELDEITKLESGGIELNKQKFNFKELAEEVFDDLYNIAEPKQIQLKFKEGCNPNISVFADRLKINQVLINLITNAIKYGNTGGYCTVAIYTVDGRQAYIEVTDNGVGIGEDEVTRVFERFYRTTEGRNKNNKGTGLGLAIVKHIVEAHGHTVYCRSAVNVGSSFGFGIDVA
jgi:two-component system, OmpR family, phosphate regulon sensor histidine kinase PhoR